MSTQSHTRVKTDESIDCRRATVIFKIGLSTFVTYVAVAWSNAVVALELVPILENVTVSESQQHVQQTPIDYWNGKLYLAYIAPGPDGDVNGTNLHTIVTMGTPINGNSWDWSTTLVEERTAFDKWHTAPGIGVDKTGFVHVAYNMHNLPWQYKVSKNSEDISEFEFQGQAITKEEIELLTEQNRTIFPGAGNASIPGNQITYPQFIRDSNDELYVSYRFAAKPARQFNERTMSSGLAKFDTLEKSWSAIGQPVPVTKDDYDVTSFPWFELGSAKQPLAIAAKEGWTSYLPRLTFGPNGRTNVNLFWREGLAGERLSKPCFLTSTDLQSWTDANGLALSMPLTPDQCSNLGISDQALFYSVGNSVADSEGNPYFILSPTDSIRQIYSHREGEWHVQDSPYSATNLFIDAQDSVWAIATGLTLLRQKKGDQDWEVIYKNEESTDCTPRAVLNPEKTIAYIYTTTCDLNHLNVYSVDLIDIKAE